jgi:WD40 repeat protein
MANILLVHPGEVALERDAAAAMAASMRAMGHELRCTWEQRGVVGGHVAALEAAVAQVDRVLLVDPLGWWIDEPTRDEWRRSLWRIVDYAVWAGIDRFAVALSGGPAQAELGELLMRLPSFVLPEGWGGLVEWLAQPRGGQWQLPIAERLPALPRRFVANDAAIVALEHAVASARDRGGLVHIRGAVGTGKSTILADWLSRRTTGGNKPICHVVRPGIAWSCDLEQVLAKCIRALLGADFVGSHADARARLDAEGSRRAIVVIDGLEQILAALAPERMQQLGRAIAAGIPRSLTVIATSRPLGPGVLALEPAIDLDAELWRTRQAKLVEQLVQRAAAGENEPSSTTRVCENAAGNLGLATALLDAGTQRETDEPTLELEPEMFTAVLERSWTAMLARAGERRGVLRAGLAILAAAPEPLPVSLFGASLREDERDAVRSHASEWLCEQPERIGFVHPSVRRFLTSELDPLDPAPHVRLLDALVSLRNHAALDDAAAAYQEQHAREHRLACHGFKAGLAWVTDVELLVSLAGQGVLINRLEAALELADSSRRALVEHALAVARRRHAEFTEQPAALPSHLWSELIGHGMGAAELLELMRWGTLLPPIRLLNRVVMPDRSMLRLGHDGDVRGCAIDATATRAISVTSDRRLHIWSVRSGERLANLDIGAWAEGCAISADGRRAVVGAGQRVSLWDLDGKKALAHHDDHGADVTTVSMSADGRTVLSTDRDGIVRVWQIDRDRRTQLGRQGALVRCGAISADGRLAITGDDDRGVVVWDIERGERIQKLPGHTFGVGAVALTSSGDLAISVCIGEARVWEPRSGQLLHTHDSLGMNTHGAVLVESGSVEAIVAESGDELHRWTVTDGQLRARHFAHAQDMTSVAATPDGKWYMTGGQDHVARVWQSESSMGVCEYPHRRAITSLCASADKNSFWISGGGDGTRRVSLVDGRELERISPSGAHALAESGDRVVTGGSTKRIEVHSRSSGAELAHWEPTNDWLRACAVDPTGTRVAHAGDEKLVFCSDFEGGALVRLSGHGDWVRGLAWTQDGRLVSVDDDGELRIWELETQTCVRKCSPLHDSAIYALALDGLRAFVAGVSGNIASVDLAGGATLVSFKGHDSAVTDLALAEPGMLVSVGRDATLRIWSIDDTDARMLVRYDAAYPFTRVLAVGGKLVAGDAAGNHLILEVDWERVRAM